MREFILEIPLVFQVVQNIVPPVPLDIPMVLIKPPQACSTAEVYKVMPIKASEPIIICICFSDPPSFFFFKLLFISQRLQLDSTSKVDPLALLEKISSDGITQDVCVNDLGTLTDSSEYSNTPICSSFFSSFFIISFLSF